jgi:hypothetical protein
MKSYNKATLVSHFERSVRQMGPAPVSLDQTYIYKSLLQCILLVTRQLCIQMATSLHNWLITQASRLRQNFG